jgi:NADPH:quinone reductase-like Zn-dependent oxidoreductase
MKAIVYHRYGSPDVLALEDVDKPSPKDDEILIRVRAVSVNDWDWGLLHGTPFANRMMSGLRKPKKKILGSDVAGRVEAVGRGVSRFRPGDRVFGDLSGRWGGFAEYVCAREGSVALMPAVMTYEDAAAIPQAGMLAVQGLRDSGRIQTGQSLLINGAGGGVGTFAIQIARLYDCETTGVDSSGKLDLLRSLGFDHVMDYASEDFTKTGRRYDLILDVKTQRSVFDCARALNPGGTYVTGGGATRYIVQTLLSAPCIALTSKKKVRVVFLKANKDLAYMAELFEAGKLRPVVDGPYSLSQTPDAMRYFGEGSHKGKVVISIGGAEAPGHGDGEAPGREAGEPACHGAGR